jgi:hypothetical protein
VALFGQSERDGASWKHHLCSPSKPSDEASSGCFIGFVAQKAERRWARGVGQQNGAFQSAKNGKWRFREPSSRFKAGVFHVYG